MRFSDINLPTITAMKKQLFIKEPILTKPILVRCKLIQVHPYKRMDAQEKSLNYFS